MNGVVEPTRIEGYDPFDGQVVLATVDAIGLVVIQVGGRDNQRARFRPLRHVGDGAPELFQWLVASHTQRNGHDAELRLEELQKRELNFE